MGLWVTWIGPSSDRATFGDLLLAESKAQKSLARSCVPSARRGGCLGVGFRITSRLVKLAEGGQLAGAWGVHICLVVPMPAPGSGRQGPVLGPLLSPGQLREATVAHRPSCHRGGSKLISHFQPSPLHNIIHSALRGCVKEKREEKEKNIGK